MLKVLRSAAVPAAITCALAASSAAGQSKMPVATEFDRLHFRSIGPATMSGRISDLAVYEANPAIYYVGTAHGGVWKTTNNGATFTPQLQHEGLLSIGDVAVSQKDPNLVWVGTGESNNRQSTSWGDGVWKSTDGGAHYQHMGLGDSKHINRIVIDQTNNDVVLVAATGPLFGPGGDRGVYKTTDGGRTWKLVLNVDDETGANDLVQSPTDPRVFFASTYQRRRTTCCMNGGGPGSAIYKSTDGGDTWTKLTGGGLPGGTLGRIALDVYRKNGNIVYASIEGPGGRGGPPPGAAAQPDSAAGRGGRGGRGGGRGGGGRGGAAGGGGGAVAAGGVYRSEDGGRTWTRLSGNNPRPMYFSQTRIDPNNDQVIYQGGVGMQMSIDGGRNFETDASQPAHDDIHAIWIDPANSDHLIIGGDGGVYESRDQSKTWRFLDNLPVGLFYHVSYDMEIPYNVCGGMQDNYNWCGPSASRMGRGIMNYDWFQILGGDGFVATPDRRDSRIIYTESQDGNIIRRNKITGESKSIRPTPQNVVNATPGEPGYRFHWDTPLLISENDPGVLLVGANRVFKSTDRGDSWTAISPDLTRNENRNDIVTMGLKGSDITISRNDGISQWPAIVALAESPKQAGVYYAGTDDGVVQMSRDGGKTWTDITSRLPGFPKTQFVFISEVVPSRFDAGTVYITVDNHRENDYNPYIWVSNDFGATFRSLNGNLTGEVVRTLTEDTRNPDVLYIGTESGIFLTLDRGKTWRRLKGDNFPNVRVDELTIHPRDNSLLVASHGRSLWILDHLEPIQEYTASLASNAKLFTPGMALQWKSKDDRNDEFWGQQVFVGENPPTDAVIQFNINRPLTNPALRFTNSAGATMRELPIPANRNQPGIQTVCWDMRVDPITNPADSAAGTGRGGPPGGGGGAGGRGGRGGRGGGPSPVPGVPAPLPVSGYMPSNPCGGGGGFGGGRGGGGGAAGPHVIPGTYTVALVDDGKVVDTKPIKVVMDPAVQFTDANRKRYFDMAMDLHTLQRNGTAVEARLGSLATEIENAIPKVVSSNAPDNVKAQFATFVRDFTNVGAKFGVGIGPENGGQLPAGRNLSITQLDSALKAMNDAAARAAAAAAGGGRGGRGGRGGGRGGRGGGPGDDANVLGRVASVKGAIISIWEMPSEILVKQYNEVKAAMPAAITEANGFITRARTMSTTFGRYGVTMLPPR